jgi:hypothetical protein
VVDHVECDPKDGHAYAIALGKIIRRRNVDVLIPVNSEEIRALMRHRAELHGTLDYAGNLELYQQLLGG